MLVLTRKNNEKIIIQVGKDIIEVSVARIDAQNVRIGIEAAPHIIIKRQEIFNKDKK